MKKKYWLWTVLIFALVLVAIPIYAAWSKTDYDDATINRNETHWSVYGEKGAFWNATTQRYIIDPVNALDVAGIRRINSSSTVVGVNMTATKEVASDVAPSRSYHCYICIGNGSITSTGEVTNGYCWDFDIGAQTSIKVLEGGIETSYETCTNQQSSNFNLSSLEFYYNDSSNLIYTNQNGSLCNKTNSTWSPHSTWFYSITCKRTGVPKQSVMFIKDIYDILYTPPTPLAGGEGINTSTYNVTTAISDTLKWRTNEDYPIGHINPTPEVTLSINGTNTGNCSIGTSDLNHTDMITADATTKCSTVDVNLHSCELPATQPLTDGKDYLYISCKEKGRSENLTSSSGTLRIGRPYFDYKDGNFLETQSSDFNMTAYFNTSVYNPIITFEYNSSSYSTSKLNQTGKAIKYQAELIIPLVSRGENAENKTYWWDLTTFSELTDKTNQTVWRINISNCSATAGFNNYTLNLSLLDEVSNDRVLGDLDSIWKFWATEGDSSIYREYSNGMDNQKNFTFCLRPNWANLTAGGSLYYSSDGYGSREARIIYHNLDNVSENVNLYLLDDSNSTTFQMTVRDASYIYYSGVILKTLKYDASTDSYFEVESSKTNEDGRCLTHLILEDVYYKFMVSTSNGTILHTTSETKAYCPQANVYDQCLMEIVIATAQERPHYSWDTVAGLSYALSWNNVTNITSLSYSFAAGTVSYIRFKVSQGDDVICNTNQSAIAGVINCDVSGHSGQLLRQVYLSRSNELLIHSDYTINLDQFFKEWGVTGLFWTFIFMLFIAAIGIASGNPMFAVVLCIAALGVGVYTEMGGLGIGTYLILVVAAALIVSKFRT